MRRYWGALFLVGISFAAVKCQSTAAYNFLKRYNKESRDKDYEASQPSWTYSTNISDINSAARIEASSKYGVYASEVRRNASKIDVRGLSYDTQRQFRFILSTASSKNKETNTNALTLETGMEGIYSTGCVNAASSDVETIPINGTKCLQLDPDLTKILRKSRNYTELLFAWKGWRDATGPKIRPKYQEFVKLKNKGADENNWKDYGAYLRSWYEVDNLAEIAENLWLDLKPFYEELHAYVRFKLSKVYPLHVKPKSNEPMPAHIFGNMWAQSWDNIYDLVVPFPNETSLDVTNTLKKEGYNVTRMFKVAEDFFVSLGWGKLPNGFWKKSMLKKPTDGRKVVCHASAWNFGVKNPDKDVRVKMCTSITQDDFITIHHELGHIYYYLLYWDQPAEYRTGANPGFHEAVGDTLALSVNTPNHLYKIGLLQSLPNNSKSDLNFLMKTALEKIAFLPFGYLIDQWRWNVYSGDIEPSSYNKKWWQARTNYQGIKAPVTRSEADFDPGAKYHIPANTPYIRYFMSYVYQFQFHKAACDAAGHKGPLHTCSIYNSTAAGKKLGDMLKQGKSRPWLDVFEEFTGNRTLTAGAIKQYFDPIYKWMKKQRKAEGYPIGWKKVTIPAEEFLKKYNKDVVSKGYTDNVAAWKYNTNLTENNKKKSVSSSLAYSKYYSEVMTNASMYNISGKGYDVRRQFKMILSTANSKDETTRKKVAESVANMEGFYSKGCVNATASDVKIVNITGTKCLPLDPDLYTIMRKSRNYKELLFAWKGWRDATGPKIRPIYKQFIGLLNKGAKENSWSDYGAYLRSSYEVDNFQGMIEKFWLDVKPFYEELHAYVRFKLSKTYTEVKDREPIPAHILGNMWAQSWDNIYELVVPFKDEPNLDITPILKKQGYSVTRMFEIAEDFFNSIGWGKLPKNFWKRSMLEKPKDKNRKVVCHASAWDFFIKDPEKDVRVKMCTSVNQDDFITIHHELGHIYYFMLYWDLPFQYRDGANNGFHEAVGDTLALSVQTPQHLYKIGLLDKLPSTNRSELNFLLKSALEKIAFLPFGYLIDQWRWKVYRGEVTPSNYNAEWWKLRTKYQGIKAPIARSEGDFDPGAKYHIPSNVAYIRYFLSYVYQFQFHKSACDASGHKGPLHTCSIYNSTVAGKKLGDMLKMGKSRPWPDAFKMLTDTRTADAKAVKSYFEPLYKWLQEQRQKEKYSIGWKDATPPTPPSKSIVTRANTYIIVCLLVIAKLLF